MTWWQRSLIVGGVALGLTAGVALLFGCCGPGAGLYAGALAGWWCATDGAETRQGAYAGALVGGLTLVGQVMSGGLTLALLPALTDTPLPAYPLAYTLGGLLSSGLLGLVSLALATGAGTAATWAYRSGR